MGLHRFQTIPTIRFQYEVNLNLPEFDNLRFAGGTKVIHSIGYKGVMLINLTGDSFLAWEATCSNHSPESCSKLFVEGVIGVCSCEDAQYSLATGQLLNPNGEGTAYPLLNYQIRRANNSLVISN